MNIIFLDFMEEKNSFESAYTGLSFGYRCQSTSRVNAPSCFLYNSLVQNVVVTGIVIFVIAVLS